MDINILKKSAWVKCYGTERSIFGAMSKLSTKQMYSIYLCVLLSILLGKTHFSNG